MQVLSIPILVLNFRIQLPRNSESLKYPFLGLSVFVVLMIIEIETPILLNIISTYEP